MPRITEEFTPGQNLLVNLISSERNPLNASIAFQPAVDRRGAEGSMESPNPRVAGTAEGRDFKSGATWLFLTSSFYVISFMFLLLDELVFQLFHFPPLIEGLLRGIYAPLIVIMDWFLTRQ